jgi:hypothetical protein
VLPASKVGFYSPPTGSKLNSSVFFSPGRSSRICTATPSRTNQPVLHIPMTRYHGSRTFYSCSNYRSATLTPIPRKLNPTRAQTNLEMKKKTDINTTTAPEVFGTSGDASRCFDTPLSFKLPARFVHSLTCDSEMNEACSNTLVLLNTINDANVAS